MKDLEMSVKQGQNRTYGHGKITIKDNGYSFKEERVVKAKRQLLMLFSHCLKNHIHVLNNSNN